MPLKENIDAVKKEIGAEEQFLESVIKGERFFKRHKKSIISLLVVLILGGIGYSGYNIISQNNLLASNEAYDKLLANPKDQEAQNILKNKNDRLYHLFLLQQALKGADAAMLSKLAAYSKDPVISDLAAYELAALQNKKIPQSTLLGGFTVLHEGYALILDNKISQAKIKFAQIDTNSPLKNIANNLEHYQGKK